jgi:hypothetical protein
MFKHSVALGMEAQSNCKVCNWTPVCRQDYRDEAIVFKHSVALGCQTWRPSPIVKFTIGLQFEDKIIGMKQSCSNIQLHCDVRHGGPVQL